MSLDSIDDDSVLHILRYASPDASARLGLTSKIWGSKVLENERLWNAFAIDRWGGGVSVCEPNASWYRYYRHRCSSWKLRPASQGTSHLDLVQECYASDPYHLLTACILCSRTSGGPLIRTVVRDFLSKYDTPTKVLDADLSAMGKELHPLGLKRERIMKRFAGGFLGNWTDVTEMHGCGAFASASFDVFCHGDYKKVLKDKKADRNVRAYASYLKEVCEHSEEEGLGPIAIRKKRKATTTTRKRPPHKERRTLPVRKMTRKRKGGSAPRANT
mmetsp:Transcript_34419/g.83261  ORF Transcript_34419/g.83261 Transcript_34419/m.83261 type:complete len:273 (-) Transcript_34419:574-1392(-)